MNGYYKQSVEIPDAEGKLLFWDILYGGVAHYDLVLDKTIPYIIDPKNVDSSFLDGKLKSGDDGRSGAEITLYDEENSEIAHAYYHENSFKNIIPLSVGSGAGSSKLFYHSLYVLIGDDKLPGRLVVATVVRVR